MIESIIKDKGMLEDIYIHKYKRDTYYEPRWFRRKLTNCYRKKTILEAPTKASELAIENSSLWSGSFCFPSLTSSKCNVKSFNETIMKTAYAKFRSFSFFFVQRFAKAREYTASYNHKNIRYHCISEEVGIRFLFLFIVYVERSFNAGLKYGRHAESYLIISTEKKNRPITNESTLTRHKRKFVFFSKEAI